MSNGILSVDRAMGALDAILPNHTHHGDPRGRWWSMRTGRFSLNVVPAVDLSAVIFKSETGLWNVHVPLTVTGLDALALAMVLAGAIEAPDSPANVAEQFGHVWVTPTSKAWGAEQTPVPRFRPGSGGADAFALGVAIIRAAGETPARWPMPERKR